MAKVWLCYVSLLVLACKAATTAAQVSTTDASSTVSTTDASSTAATTAAVVSTTDASSTAATTAAGVSTTDASSTAATTAAGVPATDGADPTKLPEGGIILTCSAQTMTVTIPTKIVPGIEAGELGFGNDDTSDQQCLGKVHNVTTILLTANLTECGTNMTETNDTEVYTNSIINVYPTGSPIYRGYEVNIPLTCRYNRTQRLGGMDNVSYVLTDYDITNQLEEEGSYSLGFDIFKDSNYQTPYDSYPVTFKLNDDLYFAASLDYPNDELVLSMRACRATPDSNYDNGDNFDFITEGCPDDDGSTNITNINGGSKKVQVKTNTFRFIDHGEFVYIHCDLLVCDRSDNDSVCNTDDCSGTASPSRKRRDVSSSLNSKRFTRGPLRVIREAEVERIDPGFSSMNLQEQESAPQQAASSAMNPWVMAIAILGLAVMALAAMMVIVLSKVNRMTVSSRPEGIKE